MKKSYDVVIIGGGIIGCSVAFELAKRGRKDVLVVEQEYLTSGATGRCGAGIRQQWGSMLNATLALESTHVFENLEEYTGYDGDCGLNQGGYLLIAYTEKEWEQFQKNLEIQHQVGINSHAVPLDCIKEIVPHINTDGIQGACFCASDGHADPFHCTYAYAKGAQGMGVEIVTYTKVTGLKVENGRIRGVATTRGDIEAKVVINATGGHAAQMAMLAGDELPIFPERHQILITEPVAHIMNPMVMSFHRHFYVQQTPHGSVIMGMGDPNEPVSLNTKASWQYLEHNAWVVTQTLPAFRNLRVVRQWAGHYDMSPDRNPIINEAKSAEGFITIAGFSGHGFMVAPRTAILVSNYLTGQQDSLDISRFSVERYKTGELLLEPSVV
ncbi:MAG: FAD-binding oxidoreductase [Oscillospiraceae bacterium]|nr:FAD-binding oxidoreductase [Oscillospiraceae bacterium]